MCFTRVHGHKPVSTLHVQCSMWKVERVPKFGLITCTAATTLWEGRNTNLHRTQVQADGLMFQTSLQSINLPPVKYIHIEMRGQVWAEIFFVPTSAHIYIYLNFLINTKQHNYFLFNICTRFEQLKPGTIITQLQSQLFTLFIFTKQASSGRINIWKPSFCSFYAAARL